jgi:hypothetical protein
MRIAYRRRNPSQAERAKQGFEHFHGTESTKVTLDDVDWPPPAELEEKFGPFQQLPEDVALLGELVAVMYEDDDTLDDEVIEFSDPLPFLVTDYAKRGRECLYITGGEYEVDTWDDFICGPLRWICYLTAKSFDDMQPTEYKHWFTEPTPILAHNYNGTQLYILRGESRFRIDRTNPTSLGIDG